MGSEQGINMGNLGGNMSESIYEMSFTGISVIFPG